MVQVPSMLLFWKRRTGTWILPANARASASCPLIECPARAPLIVAHCGCWAGLELGRGIIFSSDSVLCSLVLRRSTAGSGITRQSRAAAFISREERDKRGPPTLQQVEEASRGKRSDCEPVGPEQVREEQTEEEAAGPQVSSAVWMRQDGEPPAWCRSVHHCSYQHNKTAGTYWFIFLFYFILFFIF